MRRQRPTQSTSPVSKQMIRISSLTSLLRPTAALLINVLKRPAQLLSQSAGDIRCDYWHGSGMFNYALSCLRCRLIGLPRAAENEPSLLTGMILACLLVDDTTQVRSDQQMFRASRVTSAKASSRRLYDVVAQDCGPDQRSDIKAI